MRLLVHRCVCNACRLTRCTQLDLDGSTPSGIAEAASTSAAGNSGAVALLSSTGGFLGLLVSAMVALAPLVLMA